MMPPNELWVLIMLMVIVGGIVLVICLRGIFGGRENINKQLAKLGWRLREDKIALRYLKDKKRILDIGCGDGDFMEYFPLGRITGIDLDPKRIAVCRAKGLNVLLMDARNIELDEQYDAICSSHLIEHLYSNEFMQFLKGVDRLLVDGGILILRAPQMWKGFYDTPDHKRPYPPCSTLYELPNYKVLKLVYTSAYRNQGLLYPSKPKLVSYYAAFQKICSYLGVFFWRKDVYILVLQKGR